MVSGTKENGDNILNTNFYVYHTPHGVYLGVILPFGVVYELINRDDWIDWLRQELQQNSACKIPDVFFKENN